ncbi:MAG: hypothetical protein ACLSUM_14730 [Dysosmobacter welbionis]
MVNTVSFSTDQIPPHEITSTCRGTDRLCREYGLCH